MVKSNQRDSSKIEEISRNIVKGGSGFLDALLTRGEAIISDDEQELLTNSEKNFLSQKIFPLVNRTKNFFDEINNIVDFLEDDELSLNTNFSEESFTIDENFNIWREEKYFYQFCDSDEYKGNALGWDEAELHRYISTCGQSVVEDYIEYLSELTRQLSIFKEVSKMSEPINIHSFLEFTPTKLMNISTGKDSTVLISESSWLEMKQLFSELINEKNNLEIQFQNNLKFVDDIHKKYIEMEKLRLRINE